MPNLRLPVGGGLTLIAMKCMIRVNVKASQTRVHTCSGSKVTCACVLTDDDDDDVIRSTKHISGDDLSWI